MKVQYVISTNVMINLSLCSGKTPVRVFFHVDYKPHTVDGLDKSRKVAKDDIPSLESQLQIVGDKIKEISTEIEHARHQEIYLKEAGGNVIFCSLNDEYLCAFVRTNRFKNSVVQYSFNCYSFERKCLADNLLATFFCSKEAIIRRDTFCTYGRKL
jgi:hypothetical protein